MSFNTDVLEQMILDGVVEFAGMTDDGEMLYSFSKDLQAKNPELYQLVSDGLHSAMMSLWEKRLVDITMEEEDPTVTLVENYRQRLAEVSLTKHEKTILKNIIDQTS